MQQMRINACKNLPADHPLQPPMIDPIQSISAALKGEGDCVGTDLANTNVSSSTPNSPTTQTTEITEQSIISNLESHYSGELPEYVSNSQIISDIASDEVMTEYPPQHEPNQEMATTTNNDYVLIPEMFVPELTIPEQPVSNLYEVKVLRTWVKTPLCLKARSVIPSSIHPRELNLDWLNKINFKEASSDLALQQRNTLLEKENKQLKKELLEQKLMLLEYKTATEAQLEEAKIKEERLIKSNEDFKQEMKQQAEETQKMMKQMMEMMLQKQAQP